jgi:hypothetical protein
VVWIEGAEEISNGISVDGKTVGLAVEAIVGLRVGAACLLGAVVVGMAVGTAEGSGVGFGDGLEVG